MAEPSFLSRVRRHLDDLHPAERRLGELVSDFPGELASYSASELADLAGVSNATVSRFVRRLGYGSYEEARRHAREEQASGSRLYLGDVRAPASDDPRAYAESDIRNLHQTLDGLEQGAVERLAAALLAARKVWIVGFRAAAPLAHYLNWQLVQVLETTAAIPRSGETLGEHLASIRRDDVVILFGLRRRVAQTEAILAAALGAGARVAYITDEGVGPRADVDWHIRCRTGSPGPLFSHVSVMGVLNLVANRTIAAAGETGRRRLAAIESANDSLGEL